jgi:subtilisin family serine protease
MRQFVLALFALTTIVPLFADDDDEFLLRPAPGALSRVMTRYRLDLKKSFPDQNLYLVKPIDDDDIEDRIRGDRDVLGFEKNEELFAPEVKSGSTSPNEQPLERALQGRRVTNYFGASVWEGYARQPLAAVIGLPQAQSRGMLGTATVAVIDTGVDAMHPALAGALVNGYDFTREAAGIPDDLSDVDATIAGYLRQSTTAFIDQSTTAFIDNTVRPVPINQYAWAALAQSTTAFIDTGKLPTGFGHGTMVASMIRLSAPAARIMPIKAFRADGSSDTFNLVRAIYFATDRGAKVINMSFHMKAISPEMTRAVNYAAARNVILVSSAGNDGNEVIVWPAAYPKVMGIASTDLDDQRSGFSNYGAAIVTMAAPGEGVIVAYPGNNYASAWGTSFSTPLVSGAVTLLLQRNPSWSAAHVERELTRRAKGLSAELGAGRLDLQD